MNRTSVALAIVGAPRQQTLPASRTPTRASNAPVTRIGLAVPRLSRVGVFLILDPPPFDVIVSIE